MEEVICPEDEFDPSGPYGSGVFVGELSDEEDSVEEDHFLC